MENQQPAPNRLPFDQHLAHYKAVHDTGRLDIDYQQGLAAGTIQLVINALILINAGALVALSPLRDAVEWRNLWWAAFLLIAGLVLALLTGAFQIWNARLIATVCRNQLNATLVDIINRWQRPDGPQPKESPVVAEPERRLLVTVTMCCGWISGSLSVAAFTVASLILCFGAFPPAHH